MKRALMILLALSCTAVLGCAKHKAASGLYVETPRGGGVVPPITGGGTGPGTGTNEVTFAIEGNSNSLLSKFYGGSINNPQNIRIGISTSNDGEGYAGQVWIYWEDNGVGKGATLSTNHPLYASTSDSSPNQWFTYNGQTVFHGFFQDDKGAIVVVIDQALNLGDGQASELVGGRVYFQNFGSPTPPQGPAKMCWEISVGPYDCRTFIVGKSVVTTSALYPNNKGSDSIPERPNYQLLGRFSGMSRSAAFGN